MRKIVIMSIVAFFLFSLVPVSLLAQGIKIGYIDSTKIFAEYKETQEAERIYKKEVEAWKAKASKMEQEIMKLQDELKAQSLMLSEEKQREKKLELDRKMQEYQKFMDETFGENGLAARRNKELTQPIVDKINAILDRIGKEEGFTIIFDTANSSIVYTDKEQVVDLTDKVLEELNKPGK